MPRKYSSEEIVRRAESIYERTIRQDAEEKHHGAFVIIDVETGAYRIGTDAPTLAREYQSEHPDAVLYAMRVGYRAAGRIGARRQLRSA